MPQQRFDLSIRWWLFGIEIRFLVSWSIFLICSFFEGGRALRRVKPWQLRQHLTFATVLSLQLILRIYQRLLTILVHETSWSTICAKPHRETETTLIINVGAWSGTTKWNTNFHVERPNREKRDYPFPKCRFSRIFSTGRTQKVVFHSLFKLNFWHLFVNGKEP